MGVMSFSIFVSVNPITSNSISRIENKSSNSSLCRPKDAIFIWNKENIFFLVSFSKFKSASQYSQFIEDGSSGSGGRLISFRLSKRDFKAGDGKSFKFELSSK